MAFLDIFKQKKDEIVAQYQDEFYKIIDSMDDNSLNKVFTELTILNILLDKNDSFISKVKDYKKKNESIDKKRYIQIQFEDLLHVSRPYSSNQINMIKKVLDSIVPSSQMSFLDSIREYFDNMMGRKK